MRCDGFVNIVSLFFVAFCEFECIKDGRGWQLSDVVKMHLKNLYLGQERGGSNC